MITESKLSELLTTPDPWVVWWEREALIAEIRCLRVENAELREGFDAKAAAEELSKRIAERERQDAYIAKRRNTRDYS